MGEPHTDVRKDGRDGSDRPSSRQSCVGRGRVLGVRAARQHVTKATEVTGNDVGRRGYLGQGEEWACLPPGSKRTGWGRGWGAEQAGC